MTTLTGVVEYVKDGKSLKIDGEWYGAFASSQVGEVEKGDTVTFEYVEKGKYKNIKGQVKKTSATSRPAPTSSSGASSGGGYAGGRSFPVAAFSPERSIIRQNALTQANKLFESIGSSTDDADEFAAEVIRIARKFEAYATGDLDIELVDAELRALAVHAEER